jgi:hypothetical protein
MLKPDDIEFAVENTEVILAPRRRIETFGTTVFRFLIVSELMDHANQVRVRDGEIHAERPQIISPQNMTRLMLEGFGEDADEFGEYLRSNRENLSVLKYGFQIRRGNVQESVVHDSITSVSERLKDEMLRDEEDMAAVIRGVDDAWEISLLKFTFDLIRNSAGRNMGDFRQEGLL